MDMTPLDYMMKCFPDVKEVEEMRRIIGRYGLSGKQQVRSIRNYVFNNSSTEVSHCR